MIHWHYFNVFWKLDIILPLPAHSCHRGKSWFPWHLCWSLKGFLWQDTNFLVRSWLQVWEKETDSCYSKCQHQWQILLAGCVLRTNMLLLLLDLETPVGEPHPKLCACLEGEWALRFSFWLSICRSLDMWVPRNFSASSIHSGLTSTNAALYSWKYLERWFSWVMYAYLVTQSYLTLCHPMDYSPSGSFVHGILQGRILEWVAMPFFRGLFQPRDQPEFLIYPALADRLFTTSA